MAHSLHHGEGPIAPNTFQAADRFGKYKKEELIVLRKADVHGDTQEALRRKRELLLGMSPEMAKEIIEFHDNVNCFEALALAKRECRIIVPNFVHDRILTETDENKKLVGASARPMTGTMVIFPEAGMPFGKKIVYEWEDYRSNQYSISFVVPARFRGKSDCRLIVEHPDFDLVATGKNTYDLIADRTAIHLLDGNLYSPGNYRYDERYRLPIGCRTHKKDSESQRYSLNIKHGKYIGLVVRVYDSGQGDFDAKRFIEYEDGMWNYSVALF